MYAPLQYRYVISAEWGGLAKLYRADPTNEVLDILQLSGAE